MTPGQQQRKDAQDEARRQQQADERIRELERRLAELSDLIRDYFAANDELRHLTRDASDEKWQNAIQRRKEARARVLFALDGGGDADE